MDATPERKESCARHTHVCRDILYDFIHHEPVENMLIDQNKFQGRCVADAVSTEGKSVQSFNKLLKSSPSLDEVCNWNEAIKSEFCIYTNNKLTAEITHSVDAATLTKYVKRGIYNFGIDLFYGSVQQNIYVVNRLREAVRRESEESGFAIPLSIYLRISPRRNFTGGLRSNRESFFLKLHTQVVLTSDRLYASRCCRSIIYVNAKFVMSDVQKCDIIRVGDEIQLKVTEGGFSKLTCKVIAPGEYRKRTPVYFPRSFDWALNTISAEELEDLTFARGLCINVIVMNTPGLPTFVPQMREAMDDYRCCHYYLFTRLTLKDLATDQYENVKWIVDGYDGFLLDCRDKEPHSIVKLSPVVHKFVTKVSSLRKPFFLAGCWSLLVHSADYGVAFFYPDKYILPCKTDFLHLYESFSHMYALEKCADSNYNDKSSTGSSTIARSIAATSLELRADIIIMCAGSGQMAEKIAHHKPEAVIIAVTNVASAVNYACMHHNIWMLAYDPEKSANISHKKDVHQKLIHGLKYALRKKLINATSRIILAYRKLKGYGFTDKFVVMRYSDDYEEQIKNAILAK